MDSTEKKPPVGNQRPVPPVGSVKLFNEEAMAEHRERRKNKDKEAVSPRSSALAAAAAAGAPPRDEPALPATDDSEPKLPAPEPQYVAGELPDGRKAYCPKSAHIIVEGVGAICLADIIRASANKKGVELSDLIDDVVAESSAASSPALSVDMSEAAAGVFPPNEPSLAGDAETSPHILRAGGPEFIEASEQQEEEKEEEKEERQFFLDRRMAQEARVNKKIGRMEDAILSHPGIKQPLEATGTVARGAGRVALQTKPKEVKVVCTLF